MIAETDAAYDRRRAGEERVIAARAADSAGAIAHRELADLHAAARPEDTTAAPRATPLDVAIVDGDVAIMLADGTVATLTPAAALATADRLADRAHQAARCRPA